MNAYHIFDEFLDGVFIFNKDKEIVYCNEIGATIFGTRPKRVIGKKTFEVFRIQDDSLMCTVSGQEGRDQPSRYIEVAYLGKDTQGLVQMMVKPCPIYPDESHWLCYFHNVTEEHSLSNKYRREADEKEKASLLATTDAMTGLRNFRSFTIQVATEITTSIAENNTMGLVIVDVDRFKKFNDTYGHQQGDEVLKVVAKTLRDNLRKTDFVARYGGEEFVVILPKTDMEGIAQVCEKMRSCVEAAKVENINEAGGVLSVTASFGAVCITPDFMMKNNEQDYKFFLEFSDKNLYQAKEGGRNRSVVTKLD